MHLFAARGFEEVSVAEIARAVGISDRTFFRYFQNKDEVLLALPLRVNDAIHDALQRQPLDAPILTSIRRAMAHTNTVVADRQRLLRWTRVVQDGRARLLVQRVDAGRAYRDFLAERLGGDPVEDLRIDAVATALAAVQGAAFQHWIAAGGRSDLEALSDEALSALFAFARLIDADPFDPGEAVPEPATGPGTTRRSRLA
jgi:AcrR family transcriptional regulator